MKWPWQRAKTSDQDVDVLLAQANAASPTGAPGNIAAAPPAGGSFRMTVEDIFHITGRGLVATGRIELGSVTVGQQVRVLRAGTEVTKTYVTGVEMFRKVLQTASAGDNVGLLLGAEPNVTKGDVLES